MDNLRQLLPNLSTCKQRCINRDVRATYRGTNETERGGTNETKAGHSWRATHAGEPTRRTGHPELEFVQRTQIPLLRAVSTSSVPYSDSNIVPWFAVLLLIPCLPKVSDCHRNHEKTGDLPREDSTLGLLQI